MEKYEGEDEIYIDVHIPSGLWPNADGRAGGAYRSVETGAEFDRLRANSDGAGIEDEILNRRW